MMLHAEMIFSPPAPRLGQSTIFVLQQSPPVQHIDRTRLKRIRPSLRWHFNHHSFVMCSPEAQSLSSCASVTDYLSTRAMAAVTQRPRKSSPVKPAGKGARHPLRKVDL